MTERLRTTAPGRTPRGQWSRSEQVRALARQTARRSYALTKWRLVRRLERLEGNPIVIFTMGKTGSSALLRGLAQAVDEPVFKIHLLQPDSVRRAEQGYRRTDPSARPRHILHATHLQRHLPTEASPWRVISIVRDPIARAASDFFQSGARRQHLTDPATVTARFERFAVREAIPRAVGWFDEELRPSLGIDVFAHPFDPAVGHATIETPAVRLLLLRQEDLAEAGGVVATFLGLAEPVAIAADNVGASKPYSSLYAHVLEQARFDERALELAYSSRVAEHFYSEAERRRFAERWRNGPAHGRTVSGP